MTERPTRFRDRIRAVLTLPAIDDQRRWRRAVLRTCTCAWRTVVVLAVLALVFLAIWLLGAVLLVAAPHAMVDGTVGGRCETREGLDCFRAVADARQAVLLLLGGLIALVGIVFTYLRWRAERDSTDETIEEGKRASERHIREAEQLEITRITDALTLLESEDHAKRTAAISLLTDYAVRASDERHARLIADVLIAFLTKQDDDGFTSMNDSVTPERRPIDAQTSLALKAVTRISSKRDMDVELSGLTFVDLKFAGGDWTHVRLTNVTFTNCNLVRSQFGRPHPRVQDGTKIASVRFINCNLAFADFANTKIQHSTFEFRGLAPAGPGLRYASFENSTLVGVTFKGAPHGGSKAFYLSVLDDVVIDESFTDLEPLIGAKLINVRFIPKTPKDPRRLILDDGSHRIPGGVVTAQRVLGIVTDRDKSAHEAASAPARDSGKTPGDSRTPEPRPTNESST